MKQKILGKRKRFISSAGGWNNMDNISKLKKEIYLDRKVSKRRMPKLK